ncbi:acyloxyacyl hydrolase [Algoriphagus formosus]|uniref:Acyloxyacyl hydrolase n=1 Tax=Algoriphagus formosus TaxID=2007308 RepID=A0A4R5V7T5_9BACT|nr:acyloxyacyl hydrolase [Algoriphagus aquimaris]TDK48148.1 acyloxyacyl hydrolase [Algoriphagus aquimaris]
MKSLLPFLFMGIFIGSVYGQSARQALDFSVQRGWIIPHNEELADISQSNPIGLSLKYQVLQGNQENWEACNCFHYLGFGLQVQDFQNPAELGRAWTAFGSFQPILWRAGKVEFSLDMGIGASYLTQVYDPIENPRNTFFSAPLSFLLYVRPVLSYSIGSDFDLTASFFYNHISNGGQRQPNRGMNYPMLSLGGIYFLRKEELPSFQKPELSRDFEFYLDLGFNTRESMAGGRSPNFTLGAGFYRKFTGIWAMGAGLDLNKDFSLDVEESRLESLMPAPFLANHFLFGRFDFQQRFAWYASKPNSYQADRNFYQRYTLTYQLGKNLRLGVGMKAHGHVAENMDLRVGWKF